MAAASDREKILPLYTVGGCVSARWASILWTAFFNVQPSQQEFNIFQHVARVSALLLRWYWLPATRHNATAKSETREARFVSCCVTSWRSEVEEECVNFGSAAAWIALVESEKFILSRADNESATHEEKQRREAFSMYACRS